MSVEDRRVRRCTSLDARARNTGAVVHGWKIRRLLAVEAASCQGRIDGPRRHGRHAQPARPHDRFPCFDGVRALAALMVVVYHAVFFNTAFLTPRRLVPRHAQRGRVDLLRDLGLPALPAVRGGAPRAARRPSTRVATRSAGSRACIPAYWLVLAFFTFVVPPDQHLRPARVPAAHVAHADLRAHQPVRRRPAARVEPRRRGLLLPVPSVLRRADRCAGAHVAAAAGRARSGSRCCSRSGWSRSSRSRYGLDAPWVTVLPQHLGAFALGMLLAVLSSQRLDETHRPPVSIASAARCGSGGRARSPRWSRSRSGSGSIRSPRRTRSRRSG